MIAGLKECLSDLKMVDVLNLGMSDKTGEMVLEVPQNSEHATFAAGSHRTHGNLLAEFHVKLETVDNIVENEFGGKVDLLKIDTEGWDYKVLLGAEHSVEHNRVKFIQFEYGDYWRNAGATLCAAVNYLAGFGWEVRAITPEGLKRFEVDRVGEYFRYSNFVSAPASRVESLDQSMRRIIQKGAITPSVRG